MSTQSVESSLAGPGRFPSMAYRLGWTLLSLNLLVAIVGAVFGVAGAFPPSNALAAIFQMWSAPFAGLEREPLRLILFIAGCIHWVGVPACLLLAVLGLRTESAPRRARIGLILGIVCALPSIRVLFMLAGG